MAKEEHLELLFVLAGLYLGLGKERWVGSEGVFLLNPGTISSPGPLKGWGSRGQGYFPGDGRELPEFCSRLRPSRANTQMQPVVSRDWMDASSASSLNKIRN